MADYLLNRNGTFYYHRRIPSSILHKLPSLSPVFRISLFTGRKSEAKIISHKLSKMFDDFAKVYFKTSEEYTEALMLLHKFEWVTCTSSLEPKDITDFFEKYGKDAAEKIGKVNRVIEVRKSGIPTQVPVKTVQQPVHTEDSQLVSSLIDKFIDNQRRKNNWDNGNSSEIKYRNALKYLVELVDKNTNNLYKSDIVKVKELLIKLPDTRKYKFYEKLTIKELYNKDIPREHTISNNTIKQHADRLVTFLCWLHDNDYCHENLSKTLSGIVNTTRKKGKEPYTS